MAGSFRHIVDKETGEFTMELIENVGDAHEALEDCYRIIYMITGGTKERVNMACDMGDADHVNTDLKWTWD